MGVLGVYHHCENCRSRHIMIVECVSLYINYLKEYLLISSYLMHVAGAKIIFCSAPEARL